MRPVRDFFVPILSVLLLFTLCNPALSESNAPDLERGAGAQSSTELRTTKQRACFDTSRHIVRYVEVAPKVQLEVLDWGGSGEAIVVLTGLGNSAHIFDEFAYQFTDRFRVFGITRRGYGRSSKPAAGYDLDTRVADDIAVLDFLKINKAIFVGHSIAGVELSKLGAAYPDRVSKLVYLDAYDYGPLHDNLPAAPLYPPSTAHDGLSPQNADAYMARAIGHRTVTSDTCNVSRVKPSGKIGDSKTPAEITVAVMAGSSGLAEFDRITAPTLAMFARPQAVPPYVADLSAAEQEQYGRLLAALSVWQADVIQRLQAGVKNAQVVEVPDAAHYIFLAQEPVVVRTVRAFLLGEG